jgi:hypothetical protein
MHRLVLLHPDLRSRSAKLALDRLHASLDDVLGHTLHHSDEVFTVVCDFLLGDVEPRRWLLWHWSRIGQLTLQLGDTCCLRFGDLAMASVLGI